jgi:2-polyprenyl-3-methyl-5-hydroxy-6-metoxy-1,4-benzoquinol methylase
MMLSRDRHAVLLESLTRRRSPVAARGHFSLYRLAPPAGADEWIIVHDFGSEQIDNDLGHYVAEELLPLLAERTPATDERYCYSEQHIFEHSVGDIVRSLDGDARRAWHLFYDNTLQALHEAAGGRSVGERETGATFIRNFGAIYARAMRLLDDLPGASHRPVTVLDVATCFGFFPLFLAQQRAGAMDNPVGVIGWDLNPALVDLANDSARHRRCAGVRFERADILGDVPEGLACDGVSAIHLLEHLEPEQTPIALANLWKLPQQRLIIAVPLEETPDARFGHRQVFDRRRLRDLGRRLGGAYEVFEDHGGWLVVDRPHPRH